MASSSGSLDTSASSRPLPPQAASFFSFPAVRDNPFMTSSSLLASFNSRDDDNCPTAGSGSSSLSDRIAERTGSGVPKFKSIPPPSLPISPLPVSPSSYFAIPPGLSPAELLDSPVLLNASNVRLLPLFLLFIYALQCHMYVHKST